MNRVLILTRTYWSEAPRIRHQLTRMLMAKGYEITFLEKSNYRSFFIKSRVQEGIQFYSHSELIHHQLRYFRIIQWANNFVVRLYLRKILKRVEYDFVFNFCYEYSFLRELVGDRRIITMIEDDFESQARFGMTRAIRNQVARTCRESDCVLTVSYPLMRKLKQYNENVLMLFPWSEKPYRKPQSGVDRNTVLYFGYVHRLDWDLVKRLVDSTKYHFRFVGPVGRAKDKMMIEELIKRENFEYIPYQRLEELDTNNVFCSILPYDPRLESVQACTISNRGFNLLSLGLPLVYADLRELISAPDTVIRKNATLEDYMESLSDFKNNFDRIQSDIENFLSAHYQANRWETLSHAIESWSVTKYQHIQKG